MVKGIYLKSFKNSGGVEHVQFTILSPRMTNDCVLTLTLLMSLAHVFTWTYPELCCCSEKNQMPADYKMKQHLFFYQHVQFITDLLKVYCHCYFISSNCLCSRDPTSWPGPAHRGSVSEKGKTRITVYIEEVGSLFMLKHVLTCLNVPNLAVLAKFYNFTWYFHDGFLELRKQVFVMMWFCFLCGTMLKQRTANGGVQVSWCFWVIEWWTRRFLVGKGAKLQ